MKHLGTKKLETTRLILRPFEVSDAMAMYQNWASDSEVTRYLMWSPHRNKDDSLAVLSDWVSKYDNPSFYQWAVVLKEIDVPIGSIAIVDQKDAIEMVHVGYCIGRKWWHQGIMSEALAALIAFFFEEVGVHRLESRHDPRNANSGKVMIKCGLHYEGTKRSADTNNQGICDSAEYAILSEDYFSPIEKALPSTVFHASPSLTDSRAGNEGL